MSGWTMPAGFTGNEFPVRMRPSDAGSSRARCPQRLALKVRPAVHGPGGPARNTAVHLPVAGVHKVLDMIEFDGKSGSEAMARWLAEYTGPCTSIMAKWTEQAARNVINAGTALDAEAGLSGRMEPASRSWARQRSGKDGVDYEETVSGRRYTAPGVRELRMLRTGSVERRPRDDREIAVAAAVVAEAGQVFSKPWVTTPWVVRPLPAVDLVLVTEIGCVDGSFNVLFSGTPEEALDRYRALSAEITAIPNGGPPRPGDDCAGCPLVNTCPAVPSIPGLLGIEGPELPIRVWSMFTGTELRKCPARGHLQQARLPRDRSTEDSDATTRGRAVHDWLEKQHRRIPGLRCTADDVPDLGQPWMVGDRPLAERQARLGVQMIGDHSLTCPVGGLDKEDHQPEHMLVVHDPTANMTVVAKVDLLYRSNRRWIIRETKTAKAPLKGDPLAHHPQLALAVLLASEGVLADEGRLCSVELEQLTAAGPVVTTFDASNSALVTRAKAIVGARAKAWRFEEAFDTKPGPACDDCAFVRWCPDAKRKIA
jgi:PD-(D/E)XK nuclease superfamily protein